MNEEKTIKKLLIIQGENGFIIYEHEGHFKNEKAFIAKDFEEIKQVCATYFGAKNE